MSALDRPTADELRRGEIAAAVKNGRITPQEAEAFVRMSGAEREGLHHRVRNLEIRLVDALRRGAAA